MKDKKIDVVVIGAGMAGLGAASALADSGKKVLVLNMENKGSSSPAAGGILDPLLEMTADSPFLPFCLRAFKGWQGELKRLEKKSGLAVGYRRCGMLYAAFTPQEEETLKKRFEWQRKSGIAVSWKSREWILKKEPEMNPAVMSGLFYPSIGRVQPPRLLKAMKIGAVRSGVKFVEAGTEPEIVFERGIAQGVRVGKNFYPASAVVNAAGSWAGTFKKAGWKPPVKPARGQIIVARRNKLKIGSILHTLDGGYIVPWDPDTLLLGSTVEMAGFNPECTEEGLNTIRQKCERLVPALSSSKPVMVWAGLRPFPKDRFPIIGPARHKNLYYAAGFYRSGILIGNYAGRLLAKGIVSGRMPLELKTFDPGRFK